MDKKEKRLLRRFFRKSPARPVVSLQEETRWHTDREDGESFCEYGFLPEWANAMTDQELDEVMDEMWEEIRSPYDCTGRRFTVGIDLHRNPCGRVSYVHYFGLDV